MKILWTDGSAVPNPGPGGYAVIEDLGKKEDGAILVEYADDTKTWARPVRLGRDDDTTNIRMEGSALRDAMTYAGEEGCEIHTDSEFWVNVLTKWAPGWKAAGWRKKGGEIKNLEMVQELFKLYQKFPVRLVWVRGHVGTELNELADKWANKAREGYELSK